MRLVRDLDADDGKITEAILTLSDFLIVLREVNYQPVEGSLGKTEFNREYLAFLSEVVDKLEDRIAPNRTRLSKNLTIFRNWGVQRCRE
jgi:hypothetical protein